ncbi:hypothetical protein BDW02DRAFT_125124 [Decorospora gaudefroyi]|uniref:Uncharacterized protein n=1 Tax=Decorospora gaudefroyi TaxID=184978 RepID=A0A6A5K118_9PLEO|nr:hypothetical protein BDW02DRAFT_125124 [Decorospora gaudefroyi]
MTNEDTIMSNTAPLTPHDDDNEPDLPSPMVDFSPTTVPYNESFENDLMHLLLSTKQSPQQPPPPHHRTPPPNLSPIPASHLPIPLTSPLRTHTSPIPGLYVTHANGYHTGGPGPNPHTIAAYAAAFIEQHGIEDAGQLERVVEQVVSVKMGEVRERMERRREVLERNRGVEKELEDLRLQRAAELRVMERVKGMRG